MWLVNLLGNIALCVFLGGLTIVLVGATAWLVLVLRREIDRELWRWKH